MTDRQSQQLLVEYHARKRTRVEEGRAATERGQIVSQVDLFQELRRRYRTGNPRLSELAEGFYFPIPPNNHRNARHA